MSEFAAYLPEVFREFGPVSVRKMFGGYGVYHDGLMIGLIADDTLYLKVDAQSVAEFETLDLPQFKYPKRNKGNKGNKLVGMSYYQAPADALEDPDEMREWAQLAFAAALRSRK
jgi:DNA transformation protein